MSTSSAASWRGAGYTCLCTVCQTKREGRGLLLNTTSSYHNKWPSHSSGPEAEGNTEKRSLLRIREETPHYRATLQRCYQTQFGLFTMPPCPVAKVDFLCTNGNKPQTNQFSLSASSWQPVAADIQCGCTFRDQRDDAKKARANQRHDSKQFLSPHGQLGYIRIYLCMYIYICIREVAQKVAEITGRTNHSLFFLAGSHPSSSSALVPKQDSHLDGGSFAFLLTAARCVRYHVQSRLWQADKGEACITSGNQWH